MTAKALTQRWPLTKEQREAAVKRMLRVLVDPNASHREATSAVKALASLEAQNQSDEHKVIDVKTRNIELDAIAAELGIETSIVLDAEATRIGSDPGVEGNVGRGGG
jgi:hypothetical protein